MKGSRFLFQVQREFPTIASASDSIFLSRFQIVYAPHQASMRGHSSKLREQPTEEVWDYP